MGARLRSMGYGGLKIDYDRLSYEPTVEGVLRPTVIISSRL